MTTKYIKADWKGDAFKNIRPARLLPMIRITIGKNMRLMQTEIRSKWMTGGTARDKLATRTGKLKNSIRVAPVKVEGSKVSGTLWAGTRYAFSHMGKKGSSVVIHGKPWLTIPLMNIPESRKVLATKAGATRGGARSGLFLNTFIKKSKAGNLIIFGQGQYAKGAKAGQSKGKIVPLFILKKKVKIKRRVWIDVIGEKYRKLVMRDIMTAVKGAASV